MNANAFYYRNKQTLRNWSIYNLKTNDVENYFWTESNVDATGALYASIFVTYIKQEKLANPALKTIII